MRITIAGRVCVGNGQMMYQITRYYRGRLINEDSIDLPVNRRTAVGRSVGKIGNRIVNYITVPELPLQLAIPHTFWASVVETEVAWILLDVEILPMVLLLREQVLPLAAKKIP